MSDQDRSFLVVGAGHGGKAMAAHLARRGFRVRLFNRTIEHIAAIREYGGINLSEPNGRDYFGPLELVTADMGEALEGVDVVMVVIPANGHRDVARWCAPHLRDKQVVVLNPGRTGGALEFRHVLAQESCTADVAVAEAQTFLFASRSMGPADAKIFRVKNSVPLAALPATRTQEVLEVLQPAYSQFIPAPNVLHTSMDNIGAIFHPALTLLNAGRIESTHGDYQFYTEGVTPSVARVLENLDRERVTVAAALGIRAITVLEWLESAYSSTGSNLYEAIQNNPGYVGIQAPRTLNHRYVFEDVPMSLVPLVYLGEYLGVATVSMESMIHLASVIHGTDYRRRGRSIEQMGLADLSVREIAHYVETGEKPLRGR
ncbi:MAG: NAD/NADP octopine/nopaline dehydrogenase family protein [Chloroflexia bacterium]|nr:NAD/NADP octopine/nopaline dehydrogenase family protein [Chloroflexia bacterium]